MSNRTFLPGLRSSVASLMLASSLVGVMTACSSDTPTATQVPSTISAQLPETAAPASDSISFYYDGVKTSVTIKDAAVLFAACTLNTGDSTKIVNFVNNTLKAGPIAAADVTGLGDPLKPSISDFTGDGTVNCNDAAVLFAAATVGTDAAKVSQFVSTTLKIPGVNITQTQLDSFFSTSKPTPTPTPTPAAGPAIQVSPSSLTVNALSSVKLSISPSVAPTGGNLVLSVVSNDSTTASISGSPTLTFPAGSTTPQQVTVVGVAPGSASIVVSVAGASTATNYQGVAAVTVPVKVDPALPAGIKVSPDNVSTQVGSTVSFSVEPTQPPLNGDFVVAIASSNPAVATVNLPTVTFAQGNTAPQVVTVTGVGVGTATITLSRANTTTATNYPTVASQTVQVSITAGPPVAAKTIYVAANAGGNGSSPLAPTSFANAFQAANTLQLATPNLPVFLKVVSPGVEALPAAITQIAPVNNGTITIVPEPSASGGVAGIQLGAGFTIKSGVTVSDIEIQLSNNNLTIEGQGNKLKITDTAGGAAETVTVAAGASVTDSTITLHSGAADNDQLIVKGILANSTVDADTQAVVNQVVQLGANAKLEGVTIECQLGAGGNCVKAIGQGAQIINSKILANLAAGATVVDTDTQGLTIKDNSLIKQVDGLGNAATLVQHNGGALVIQNSTLDLNGNTVGASRAVLTPNSIPGGSLTLVGNIFKGFNNNNAFPTGQIAVEIQDPPLGDEIHQITNNQFQIPATVPNVVGIRAQNATSVLVDQYAIQSGNTFGAATTKVTKL